MPNSVQRFDINNCNVTPNGTAAQMSRSGTTYPNQAEWKNNDNQFDYTVTLSSTVWQLAQGQPNTCSFPSFTVTKGQISCIYQLLTNAPLGASAYTLTKSDGTVCKEPGPQGDPQDPDVIINS